MKLETTSQTFNLNDRTHIMGILNTTPNSFSDGGSYETIDQAVERAVSMEREGADIIDIGGESTLPKNPAVSQHEELNRVLPVIEAVKRNVTIPISIDTYKSETARQALDAGAEMINDISGGKGDPDTVYVAAEYGVPIILMQKREKENSSSLISSIKSDLQESINIAREAGVSPDNIVLDPGLGFSKSTPDNFKVMRHLNQFTEFGYPVLLGASRKSFISDVLDLPSNACDNGSGATTCFGISQGVHIIRVHDVKRHAELAAIMDNTLGKQGALYFG